MTVKVITDTGSDITPEEAKRLGIILIPLYLRFGNEVYRDGVDINADEFYRKLKTTSVHPFTSSPSPGDFAKVYNRVAQETDEIVSIHILILRAGEIHPSGFVRTRNKGMERLREFVKSALNIQDLAIVHSVVPEEAKSLAEYASSLFPHIILRIGNLGPAIGVHGGPGAIIAVIKEAKPVSL